MKKLLILSLVILSVVVIAAAYQTGESPKVTAFNTSIEQEGKKNYKQSLAALEKIYNDNSKDYLVNLRMGWLNYKLESYKKSEDYYRKAIELNGKSVEAYIGLTYPLSAKNDWKEVENIYYIILKADAMNYTANLRLGQIYLSRADYTGAKKYFEKIYWLYQSDYEINLSYGWVMYYLGDKNTAREMFTRVLMQNSSDTSAKEGYNLVK